MKKTEQILTIFLCIAAAVLGVITVNYAATTIGANIDTDGTLSVGGNATTTGSHYIGNDLTVDSGNIGIGTVNPLSSLHVIFSKIAQPRGITVDNIGDYVYSGSILLRHARGASGAETAVVSGDSIGAVAFSGYDGTQYQEHEGIIQFWAAENFVADSNYGTDMTVQLVKKNDGYTPYETARFTSEGDFGIGDYSNAAGIPKKLTVVETDAGAETVPVLIQNRSDTANTAVSIALSPYTGLVNMPVKLTGIKDTSGFSLAVSTWDTASRESIRITGAGNVGVGTTTPQTDFSVKGIMNLYPDGTGTSTCSSLIEGAIMYSTGTAGFYGCDGTTWNRLDN